MLALPKYLEYPPPDFMAIWPFQMRVLHPVASRVKTNIFNQKKCMPLLNNILCLFELRK